MDKSADRSLRERVLTGTRAVFLLTVFGALVLGYVGMERYVRTLPRGDFGAGFWNIAYYDLQLFVLGSAPLERPGPYPILLDVARFAAPAATIYAVFEAARALFAGQLRRWWLRNRRDNIIVTGETSAARALIARLMAAPRRRERRRVVAIGVGDARALRDAGIAGAKVLYACDDDADDVAVNVSAALAAANAQRKRWRTSRLRVYAQVSDAKLALALRARRLGLAKAERLDVDFFNVDELAARGLLGPSDVDIRAADPPHILIAGLGTFGRALMVEYAQHWRLHSPRRGERVTVTLVDTDASRAAAEVNAGWDVIGEVCQLNPVDANLDAALRSLAGTPLHRSYICYDDEDLALREALSLVPLWRGGPDSVVVRLNRLDRHGEAFHAPSRYLLDDLDRRLHLVGVTRLACDPGIIGKDLVERLAEAIHEQYLLEQVRKGKSLGDPANPALRRWSDLPERMRRANHAQARDIGPKLHRVGCTVAPRAGSVERVTFAAAEIEVLAMQEHDRWCDERKSEGLVWGPKRDERHHPSLVPWDRLSEDDREKDREAVRNMSTVLADVGLQIVRLREPSPDETRTELTTPASV